MRSAAVWPLERFSLYMHFPIYRTLLWWSCVQYFFYFHTRPPTPAPSWTFLCVSNTRILAASRYITATKTRRERITTHGAADDLFLIVCLCVCIASRVMSGEKSKKERRNERSDDEDYDESYNILYTIHTNDRYPFLRSPYFASLFHFTYIGFFILCYHYMADDEPWHLVIFNYTHTLFLFEMCIA